MFNLIIANKAGSRSTVMGGRYVCLRPTLVLLELQIVQDNFKLRIHITLLFNDLILLLLENQTAL